MIHGQTGNLGGSSLSGFAVLGRNMYFIQPEIFFLQIKTEIRHIRIHLNNRIQTDPSHKTNFKFQFSGTYMIKCECPVFPGRSTDQ